ncbi:hypothetical protein B0F90DRAFT_1743028 [Multifurca ochricompacta]|uniref:Uncharacterized protein n=1 Tax=Multifurca ochricompacta TaxID=376703 RepID=A0AAD4LZP2_9AGAM|nr:hypothetical protein B0F90DRAFT_1743028 [Multifurca ochricompacta]
MSFALLSAPVPLVDAITTILPPLICSGDTVSQATTDAHVVFTVQFLGLGWFFFFVFSFPLAQVTVIAILTFNGKDGPDHTQTNSFYKAIRRVSVNQCQTVGRSGYKRNVIE